MATLVPDGAAHAGWVLLDVGVVVAIVVMVVVSFSVCVVRSSAAVSAVDLSSVSLSCTSGKGLALVFLGSVKHIS